jgi:hypothetical protein
MSSISAINSVTKKFALPIEIEQIIYDFLTLEDYDKARAKFNKFFFYISPRKRPLGFFYRIENEFYDTEEELRKIKDPLMCYISRQKWKVTNNVYDENTLRLIMITNSM